MAAALTSHRPATLTKLQQETYADLIHSKYDSVQSANVTRLLKKMLKVSDERLQELLPHALDYEKAKGHDKPKEFIRDKLRGTIRSKFNEAVKDIDLDAEAIPPPGAAPQAGQTGKGAPSLPQLPTAKQGVRDIGDILMTQPQIEKAFEEPSKMGGQTGAGSQTGSGTRKIIEDIIASSVASYNAGQDLKGKVDKLPGSDLSTKMLYYEFPELQAIDQMSKAVGMGWTDADSQYLRDALDPNYSGPHKDDFKDRLRWVAKVVANPGKWMEVVTQMGMSEVKNSEAYKWFTRLFNDVAVKFDNTKAKALSDAVRTGKLKLPSPGAETKPTGGADGSRFTGSLPTMHVPVAETDAHKKAWGNVLASMFKGDDWKTQRTMQLLKDDPLFRDRFGMIYNKYHKGRRWDDANAPALMADLTPKQRELFAREIDTSIGDALKRSQIPAAERTYELAYKPARDQYDPSTGYAMDGKTEQLLRELVKEAEAADRFYVQEYYKHGRKFTEEHRDASDLRSELLPAIQRIRDLLKDPNARINDETRKMINDVVMNVPKDLAAPVSEVGDSLKSTIDTNIQELTQTATDASEQPRAETDEPTTDSPPEKPPRDPTPEEKKRLDGRASIEELKQRRENRAMNKFRPKLGFMSQQELEETLVGDAEEAQQSNYTWLTADLKYPDETPDARHEGEHNQLYDAYVRRFNMRYGATFPMPTPPRPEPDERLAYVHRSLREFYALNDPHEAGRSEWSDGPPRMIDAYDNRQWRGINHDGYRLPHYEERAVGANRANPYGALTYRSGMDHYDYRYPWKTESNARAVAVLRNNRRMY